jgi:hypothetical protein
MGECARGASTATTSLETLLQGASGERFERDVEAAGTQKGEVAVLSIAFERRGGMRRVGREK